MKQLVFPLSFGFGYDTTIFYIEFEDGSKTVMSNVSGPITLWALRDLGERSWSRHVMKVCRSLILLPN